MATFKILDTINITNRGFLLLGDITDNGTISIGDFATIQKKGTTVDLEILGIEMVDKINQQVAHVGLLVSFIDKEKIHDLDLKGKTIMI